MPRPASLTQQVVDRVNTQMERDAPLVADRLRGEMLYGTSKMSASQYLALLHRNWANPQFRQGELKRLGPVAFNAARKEMIARYGIPPGALLNGQPYQPTNGEIYGRGAIPATEDQGGTSPLNGLAGAT